MIRPPYGSHSGCRHACQKRPTSQCGWARRAAAQTVVAQRVQGDAGKALLRDRGNESLRRRLSEGAPSRGAHAGDGFIVGGSCSRAKTWLANELSVVKSGGKEVSHIEKPQGATPVTLRMQALTAARFDDIQAHVSFAGAGSKDSRLYSVWDQTQIWDPGD